jgi:O-antigen/teichoic acid export membrane protein
MLASLIRRVLPKNRFVRSVSVLAGGTVGGQALMVLAAPLLTRLYTPGDFGLLAVFVGLLSLISVVACMRYEIVIPLPAGDRDGAALFVLSLCSIAAVAVLGVLPLALWSSQIATLFGSPRLAGYLYLALAGAVLAGACNALYFWAIRGKAFSAIANGKLAQPAVTAALQLAGAGMGTLGLLIGQVAGYVAGAGLLALRIPRRQWTAIASVRGSDMARVGRRYKRAPLVSAWGALFNTAGWQLPPLLFAVLFDAITAGMYSLANRVLALPVQLIGQATASVFYSGAPAATRDGSLKALVAGIHGRLAHIGMAPLVVLMIAGPEIFSLLFGRDWRQAGVFAQWLAPWLYLVLITSPLSPLFEVLERQGAGLVFQAFELLVRVTAIVAGARTRDTMMTVGLFAAGNVACTLASLLWLLRASGNGPAEIWRSTLGALVWAAALASPLILAVLWDIDRAPWLLALAASMLLITARYAFLLKRAWL